MIFRTIIKRGGLKVENAFKIILDASKYRQAKENYPKAAMDTQSYSVATVSTRRARSVGNRQKRLSLVPSDKLGIIARHVDGRKSRSCARTKHAKEYKP